MPTGNGLCTAMSQTPESTAFTARSGEAKWEPGGLRPYFSYRDLGMRTATDGRVLAHVIRANQPCAGASGYHSHDLEFQMNYLIRGWARVDLGDLGEIRVEAGDAWYQPPNIKHELLEYSDDFEVLEITMPADFQTRDESR